MLFCRRFLNASNPTTGKKPGNQKVFVSSIISEMNYANQWMQRYCSEVHESWYNSLQEEVIQLSHSLVFWYRPSSRRRCKEIPIVPECYTRTLFTTVADDSTTRMPMAKPSCRFLWTSTESWILAGYDRWLFKISCCWNRHHNICQCSHSCFWQSTLCLALQWQ